MRHAYSLSLGLAVELPVTSDCTQNVSVDKELPVHSSDHHARADRHLSNTSKLANGDPLTTAEKRNNGGIAVDQLSSPVDQLSCAVDQLSGAFDQLSGTFDQLSSPVDQLSNKVDQLSSPVDKLSRPVDQLSNTVDQLSSPVDQLSDGREEGAVEQFSITTGREAASRVTDLSEKRAKDEDCQVWMELYVGTYVAKFQAIDEVEGFESTCSAKFLDV
jgi:outer membrane murein-binding lipoprotein Lpp